MNLHRLYELYDRLETNLTDFQNSLMGYEKQELIDMAAKIAAMPDALIYLTEHHDFNDAEVEYLLQYKKPLEIVADGWVRRMEEICDMSFVTEDIFDDLDALQGGYALIENGENRPPAAKPKQTLTDKLKAAEERAKTQDTRKDKVTSHQRNEIA